MNENIKISIVSPVYNAEKIIPELVKQIVENVELLTDNYEIILVDDCGPDNSWEVIKDISSTNSKVKGIKFSRNFGQHIAIKAGLAESTGDVAIVMDCDLQDDPVYIKELIHKYFGGADIVYTYKQKREHSTFKNVTTKGFNLVLNYLLDNKSLEADKNVGAYSLISKKVINSFLTYNDYQFHYLLVLKWLGYKSSFVEIKHNERFEGESSYTLSKLINHALIGIIYQSDKLLRLSIYFGLIVSFVSFIMGVYIVISHYINDYQSGWASIIVLLTFSLGLILTSIGVLGLYIGRLFEQTKNRPQYLIDETTSDK